MILGISSYITSAGLNAVTSAGALGPSFSPKYFLPIYSPTWDKVVRRGANGTPTSALSISALNMVGATDTLLNTSGIEKIFANAAYSVSNKVFVYTLNGTGSAGSSTFISTQSESSDVNLLNNKPLSPGLSATSVSAISNNTLQTVGRYDFLAGEIDNYLNFNPISGANPPLSAYYRVASYSPKVEDVDSVGRFKCRIPASDSSFKFNGIALYLTKTDTNGFDDNGMGSSFFSFKPVLFAVILFDQAQYKNAGVGGINDYEISVDLGFDYNQIAATSAGNPVYVETNYWNKLPMATTTSAYGLNYDGDVVISSSAINQSWTPRAKLTITDNQKEQLRLAHINERYTDFRTIQVPSSPNSDRTVLDVDTCGVYDSLMQLGYETCATGIKSIAMGCMTSATGYGVIDSLDGGYTFAQGIQNLAAGFGSVSMGYLSQSIGNLNFSYGYRSVAKYSSLNPEAVVDQEEGYNFAFGKASSAISLQGVASLPYTINISNEVYGGNFAFGVRTLANGGMSKATGYQTSATGYFSKSEGSDSIASSPYAITDGANLESSNAFAYTKGYMSSATNEFSHADGWGCLASGKFSFVRGYKSSASANMAVSIGESTDVTGEHSVAIGYKLSAYSSFVYTLGSMNHVYSTGGGALGTLNVVGGRNATAIGYASSAIGTQSVAIGTSTSANGNYSTTLGYYSVAGGSKSVAIGNKAFAPIDNSVVIGSCSVDLTEVRAKQINILGDATCTNGQSKIVLSADTIEMYGYDAVRKTNKFYISFGKFARGSANYMVFKIKKIECDNITGLETIGGNVSFLYNYYTDVVEYRSVGLNKTTTSYKIAALLFDPITMQFTSLYSGTARCTDGTSETYSDYKNFINSKIDLGYSLISMNASDLSDIGLNCDVYIPNNTCGGNILYNDAVDTGNGDVVNPSFTFKTYVYDIPGIRTKRNTSNCVIRMGATGPAKKNAVSCYLYSKVGSRTISNSIDNSNKNGVNLVVGAIYETIVVGGGSVGGSISDIYGNIVINVPLPYQHNTDNWTEIHSELELNDAELLK